MYDCATVLHISGNPNNRGLPMRYWRSFKLRDGLFSELLPKFSPDLKKRREVSFETASHRVSKNSGSRNVAHLLTWLTECIKLYVLPHYDNFACLDHEFPHFLVEA